MTKAGIMHSMWNYAQNKMLIAFWANLDSALMYNNYEEMLYSTESSSIFQERYRGVRACLFSKIRQAQTRPERDF